MEKEIIMNEIEETNEVYLNEENASTFGEKALGVALLALAVTGAIGIGKLIVDKTTSVIENRKAKKIRDAEYEDLGEEIIDSEEESD